MVGENAPGPDPRWREEYPFSSQWFPRTSISGGALQMHYLDEGPRDGVPIVFVHGNPTWSFYFRRLIRSLSADTRCICADHIGCGLSSKPSNQDYRYQLQQRIDDLAALIDHLDLPRFSLVVHDWGGAIGMGVACRFPDRIERIVAMNTAAFRSDDIPASIALCRVPYLGALLVRGANAFVLAAQWRAVTHPSRLRGTPRHAYVSPYGSWEDRVAIHEFVRDIPLAPSHPSYPTLCAIEDGLEQFQEHPVQLVWGLDDFCFHEGFYDEWRRRFPHAECHAFENAGHFVLEDAPDSTTRVIRSFLLR